MNKSIWLIVGAALGAAATYLYLEPSSFSALQRDDADYAGDKVGNWGTKQRLTGTGGQAFGKVKQGIGEALGDDKMANSGVFDQAKGAVKDAAGEVAHAVSDTIHTVNR